jgi:hypothetical protein
MYATVFIDVSTTVQGSRLAHGDAEEVRVKMGGRSCNGPTVGSSAVVTVPKSNARRNLIIVIPYTLAFSRSNGREDACVT